ncbi:hypothetical protein RJT34_16531 [Clitoria ternatea]|uniref:C2H2-type domain-containing protein n=1 Tax=Clitoria ternatea TaxID=43366 RepID=A0AAN9PDR2_CLITE
MSGLTCNACNAEFKDDSEQKLHYKSEWHRYNLKRKVAGVPRVIEALFWLDNLPLPRREVDNSENEESEDEWEEVDPDDDLIDGATKSLTNFNVNEHADNVDMDEDDDDFEELDPSCCFMCDQEHKTIEDCMVHMHKHHGFFIPDVEYLKDPKGFLTYLGLKVKRDFVCLYCNDRCYPFSSLEAVRKHMEAKSHCKVHYGDGDEEKVELEEFYDYSGIYMDEQGKQLVVSGDSANNVELLGSREFLRYYRQKPRPSPVNMAITVALASRYRSMGLTTVQSKEKIVRMKILKEMNRSGVENMRTKIAMKSNVIRNLPKNVPY